MVQRWCCLRRRRRRSDDDSDDMVQDGGEGDWTQGWTAAGAQRGTELRWRRGLSGPNAFLLLRQGGEGAAEAQQGRGVRHVEAGR